MSKSQSSLKSTAWMDRVREWKALLRLSLADAGRRDFSDLELSFQQHNEYALRYLGRPLTECRTIEVGYGARPNRLIWFAGMGVDITGIDLDQPILRGTPKEFLHVARRNGWERMLKTIGRWYINERGYRRALLAKLSQQRGMAIDVPAERLAVGDAGSEWFWNQHRGATYIFSEDVFEHIPIDVLKRLVPMMAANMDPAGVAYVKPMVFTGLCGGHHVEWYSDTLGKPIQRLTEPWEHLRKKRHPANTYLNELKLADYRGLFAEHFDILEETCAMPRLGEQFMTPEIRKELAQYSDDELFSNAVVFVLRPKAGARLSL